MAAPVRFLRWLGVFQENGNTESRTRELFCWSSSFEGHLPGEAASGLRWKNCSRAAPTTLTQLVPWQFGCDKDSCTCRRDRPGSLLGLVHIKDGNMQAGEVSYFVHGKTPEHLGFCSVPSCNISESSVASFARRFLPVIATPCVTVGKWLTSL